MLKSIANKRDIGQCEVSRLLLSEPLYSSSFEFVTISLKMCQDKQLLPITAETDNNAVVTKTLMESFANRYAISHIQRLLDQNPNLYTFAKMFNINSKSQTIIFY
jgi:hypothetical protein